MKEHLETKPKQKVRTRIWHEKQEGRKKQKDKRERERERERERQRKRKRKRGRPKKGQRETTGDTEKKKHKCF